jgi:hypothetical protein
LGYAEGGVMCDSTALMFGGSSRVPEHIAVCPECGHLYSETYGTA